MYVQGADPTNFITLKKIIFQNWLCSAPYRFLKKQPLALVCSRIPKIVRLIEDIRTHKKVSWTHVLKPTGKLIFITKMHFSCNFRVSHFGL